MLVFKNLCRHPSTNYGGLVIDFHNQKLCEVYFLYLGYKEKKHLWNYCARFGNDPEHYLSGDINVLYGIIRSARTEEQLFWAKDNKKVTDLFEVYLQRTKQTHLTPSFGGQ